MADYITPEQVPVAEELDYIPGFDAAGNWSKIPGSQIAKAQEAYATAGQAMETAAEANDTAEAAAEAATEATTAAAAANTKATEAATKAAGAQNAAARNSDLLTGAVLYNAAGSSITIYAGQFINGTLDPQGSTTNPIRAARFRSFVHQYASADGTFNLVLKGLENFLSEDLYGALTCIFLVAKKVVCGNVEIKTLDNAEGIMAFRISVNNVACTVECLSNCSATSTGSGIFLPPIAAGGGDVIAVDSELSDSSENPVQNKVVTEALGSKAPLESPVFTGTPTAPTPLALDSSNKLATTAMVQARLNYRHRNMALNSANWEFEGEIFDLKNSNEFIILAGDHLAVANTPVCANTCIAQIHPLSSSAQLNIILPNPNGYTKSVVFTGLEPGKGYIANIITITNEQIQRGTWVTISQNIG